MNQDDGNIRSSVTGQFSWWQQSAERGDGGKFFITQFWGAYYNACCVMYASSGFEHTNEHKTDENVGIRTAKDEDGGIMVKGCALNVHTALATHKRQ